MPFNVSTDFNIAFNLSKLVVTVPENIDEKIAVDCADRFTSNAKSRDDDHAIQIKNTATKPTSQLSFRMIGSTYRSPNSDHGLWKESVLVALSGSRKQVKPCHICSWASLLL